jgi:hypothetical protein
MSTTTAPLNDTQVAQALAWLAANYPEQTAKAIKVVTTPAPAPAPEPEPEARPLPKIGDFFVASWGYDQTNIDFYRVLGLTPSGKSVRVQRVQSARLSSDGYGSDKVVPTDIPHSFHPEVLTKRLRPAYRDKGWSFTLSSYADAYSWDGTPKHETSVGWGH